MTDTKNGMISPSRKRLRIEVALAALLGLLPFVLLGVLDLLWLQVDQPELEARAERVFRVTELPGALLGSLCVGWQDNERLGHVCNALGNMASYAALWFMLRTGKRGMARRRIAIAGVTLWIITGAVFALVGILGPPDQ